MILTAEEAKKKWCPMVRVVEVETDSGELSNSFNRYHAGSGQSHGSIHDNGVCRCLADDCMLWCWVDSLDAIPKVDKRRHGRCGLNSNSELEVSP